MGRALTPNTTIETLRKDAKRWLKAIRAGDPQARNRLAAAWPKAPPEAGLRDVQHALALEYGRENWIDLKAAVDDLAIARKSRAEQVEAVLHGWSGDVRVARRIFQKHSDVARDSLFTAAACGDLAEVERRLGRDPDAAGKTGGPLGWTALCYLAYGRIDDTNAVAIAERLLDAGADPNFQWDDGWGSPFKVLTGPIGLGEGVKPTHPQALELVQLLVERGADPYDLQALYNASIVGEDTYWYEVLWRLCEQKGQLDRWREVGQGRLGGHFGQNTLDYLLGNAVGQNHLVRAEWLLERGADPNSRNGYRHLAQHALAQISGFVEMAALLETHGATAVRLQGADAFRAACLRGDEAGVRAMATADPSLLADPEPLLACAMSGNAAAVRLLLSLGARVDALDREGVSPLHRAAQSGSLETVEALLAAGADVDLRERKWRGTPLSWSVVLGQPHIARRLAPIGRDVRALASMADVQRLEAVLRAEPALANHRLESDDAPTPLFCLPDDEAEAVEVARVLLAHGADPAVRNKGGETPADAARRRGLDEAAEVLSDRRRENS